jgi:hypothetical protein
LKWSDKETQELACQSIEEERDGEEAAKKLRRLFEAEADRMKAASFILPGVQPEVEQRKPAPEPAVDGEEIRLIRRPDGEYVAKGGKPKTEEGRVARPSPFSKKEEPKKEEPKKEQSKKDEGDEGDEGEELGQGMLEWPKEWPKAPLPPEGAVGFERLLYPKGLLGHAIQYVVDTAGLPDRMLALGVALSALGKGIDRKVIGPSGNTVILFILLIAETGAGKQHGLDCIRALLRAMGLEHCYAAGGLASVQAIEEIIEGIKDRCDPNPNALVVIDEVGSWLQRILAKSQLGNVSEIPSHLQILWGLSGEGAWIGTKKLTKEMRSWYSVAFSLIGFSTEKAFFKALKDRLIGSGFVNRMLLFNVGRGAVERVDPKPIDGPMRLTLPTKDGSTVLLRDFHRLGWGPGVKEACRAYEKQIRAMPSEADRELWIRTHDIALRLATVVAVYRCSGKVEMEDWNWAVEIAKGSTQRLKQGVDKHMLEELEGAELADCVRDYARTHRGRCVTIGEFRKLLERKTGDIRKINEVIWHVAGTGDITQIDAVEAKGDARGKPTTTD